MDGSELDYIDIGEAPPPSEPALSHTPPASIEAEILVLGACLHPRFCQEGAIAATAILRPEHFFRPAHRRIFKAICSLHQRGESTDFATVAAEIETTADLMACGGRAGLVEIADSVFTAANVTSHSKIVLDRAIKRELARISLNLSEKCHNGTGDAAEILIQAQTDIANAGAHAAQSTIRSADAIATESMSVLDSYKTGNSHYYIPTPFTQLNDMLGGGLREGHYSILAARPSVGKSAMSHNVAAFSAASGTKVGIFSLEMSGAEIIERIACAMARVDSSMLRLNRVSNEQFAAVAEAVSIVAGWPLYIDDSPSLSDSQLRARSKTMADKYGVKLIIIDYLQLLTSSERAENRQQAVTNISRTCMAIPKETGTSLLALSQLSRETEKRHESRPTLADLRESGSLEQDANNVMFIYHEHKYKREADPNVSEILLEKQRHGPTGAVKVAWFREYTKFTNYAPEGAGSPY